MREVFTCYLSKLEDHLNGNQVDPDLETLDQMETVVRFLKKASCNLQVDIETNMVIGLLRLSRSEWTR